MHRLPVLLCVAVLAGCVTAPPRNPSNICKTFREKHGWFADANAAYHHWGAPIDVQMAIIYQESRFVGDARPPREHLLWIIPWRHISSAYGYTQALDGTWNRYRQATGNSGADRDDFGDATDFVGWYVNQSHEQLGIPKSDAYRQYLAYYVGQGGYAQGTYRRKPWLLRTARRVGARARRYAHQLRGCRQQLLHSHHWWWPF